MISLVDVPEVVHREIEKMGLSRSWLRIRADFFDDARWVAAAVQAGCGPDLVVGIVMALVCYAARQGNAGSIEGFDVQGPVRKFRCSVATVENIMAALAEAGIIAGASIPPGSIWAQTRSSAERQKRYRRNKAQRVTSRVTSPTVTSRVTSQETVGSPAMHPPPEAAADEAAARDPGFTPEREVCVTAGQGAKPAAPRRETQFSDAELLEILVDACDGNVRKDPAGLSPYVARIMDVSPIRALLAAGADLDLDILPVLRELVAVPDQPPIPKWGGFVLDEIHARRDRRLGHKNVPAAVNAFAGR